MSRSIPRGVNNKGGDRGETPEYPAASTTLEDLETDEGAVRSAADLAVFARRTIRRSLAVRTTAVV